MDRKEYWDFVEDLESEGHHEIADRLASDWNEYAQLVWRKGCWVWWANIDRSDYEPEDGGASGTA
jgi:hypothetical protein